MAKHMRTIYLVLAAVYAFSVHAQSINVSATASALRLSNTITGGSMPTTDPLFAQMVSQIAAGNLQAAATTAATSQYAAGYLARRLAFEMQNPSLDASSVTDSDATAFLIAHFAGTATTSPSISTIWSENATYLVGVGSTSAIHAASLTAAQLSALNWSSALTQVEGQTANVGAAGGSTFTRTTIPAKHVGGYITLSDRINDTSYAQFGATAGTNLRMIEGIWEIATGASLLDVASSDALAQNAPRFVPEYNPNFFHGQGQTACIACHGGGMSSLPHGYSTVADIFDFDPVGGFLYIPTPTTATMKSLGSNPSLRATNATCNLAANPAAVCNPTSVGADPNNGWDLTKTWQASGVLSQWGWTGATTGQGLNELGTALGQASIVYQNFVIRVVNEICPLGTFTADEVSSIAQAANPFAVPAGTDDIRTIVALVASQSSCQ
jgi:hypothetical protein